MSELTRFLTLYYVEDIKNKFNEHPTLFTNLCMKTLTEEHKKSLRERKTFLRMFCGISKYDGNEYIDCYIKEIHRMTFECHKYIANQMLSKVKNENMILIEICYIDDEVGFFFLIDMNNTKNFIPGDEIVTSF